MYEQQYSTIPLPNTVQHLLEPQTNILSHLATKTRPNGGDIAHVGDH